jgi:hypothetical protein
MTNYRVVQANYYARRYDEAIRTGRIAVELTPDSPYTFFYLALALAAAGLNDEARSFADRDKQLNDGLPLGEGYFGYLMGILDSGTHRGSPERNRITRGPSRERLLPRLADCVDLSRHG